MIDPIKHPRRAAAQRDRQLAERVRALAPSLSISTIALRVGISRMQAEELCARHAIAFKVEKKK
jgi:hypothetical protein